MIFENAQKLRAEMFKIIGISVAGTGAYYIFSLLVNLDPGNLSWVLLWRVAFGLILIFLGSAAWDKAYEIMYDMDVALYKEKINERRND